ncbi:MAG: adenosyl-hopene transferase HpnH [Nitrospirota bacterium]
MRFPASLHSALTRCFVRNALAGRKRFPLVLMLEPTHRCNLACAGCDRIRLHQEEQAAGLSADLSLEECIDAAVASATPVVTVTGGEPLLYPRLVPLVSELLRMKRHVYLCTNGILAGSFIDVFAPHPRLTLNIHLDGMEKTHDRVTNREGAFRSALLVIQKAKQKGFRVSTNTSVYKTTDPADLERLFALLKRLRVDGILVAPAFSYERVEDDIFLSREEAVERFGMMARLLAETPIMNSPVYMEFLQGRRELRCTPWGNPTRNPLGWKSPCYLITDGYYRSFGEMMEKTAWDRYGTGNDPRCRDCMVHSGYEATVTRLAFSDPRVLLRLARWNMQRPQ